MKVRQQILITLTLSVGCTHSYTVASLDEINDAAINREVMIRFIDESVMYGSGFQIDSDSARWTDVNGDHHVVASHSIEYVQTKNRTRGSNYGMLFGAVGCAALGAALGDDEGGQFAPSRGGLAAIGVALGGFGGCLIGSMIGANDQFNAPDSLLQNERKSSVSFSISSLSALKSHSLNSPFCRQALKAIGN